jgi:predicted O-linked N-acetylglucosamine transferase (SPINDLY family)
MKVHPSVTAEVEKSRQLFSAGRFDLAEAAARRALSRQPNCVPALVNLGACLNRRGKPDDAIAAYRKVLAIKPDSPSAWNNLGIALVSLGRYQEAEESGRRAVALRKDDPYFWAALAHTLTKVGKFVEAAEYAERAIQLDPEYCEAYNTLGFCLMQRGMVDEAIAASRKAAELSDHLSAPSKHSNFLFDMHFVPQYSLEELATEAGEWNRRYARSLTPPREQWPKPEGSHDKQLRVGFVSADFREHPVSFFFASMLEARAPGHNWEAVGYSNSAMTDGMTERIKRQCVIWREVHGLSDDRFAAQIRQDKIDILFDLVGHTADNRLLVFARKPAPVQATWIGYFDTTGLDTIDYLLADATCIPDSLEPFIKEKVVRLPDGFLCYEPPASAPEVGPLPAQAAGHITFGTANQVAKVRPEVAQLWARILERIPNARLAIKARGLSDPETREAYLGMFERCGIGRERVHLLAPGSQRDILDFYNQIDIALDPFPCAGGTTTCEALWMGVPVVSLIGERFCNRHSASHLRNAGLGELVASSPEEYITIAERLAGDVSGLAHLRAQIRPRMAASPLTDPARFSRNFDRALRQMWIGVLDGAPRRIAVA